MKAQLTKSNPATMLEWTSSNFKTIAHHIDVSPKDAKTMVDVAKELEFLAQGLRYEASIAK